jgi:hypothetical protein
MMPVRFNWSDSARGCSAWQAPSLNRLAESDEARFSKSEAMRSIRRPGEFQVNTTFSSGFGYGPGLPVVVGCGLSESGRRPAPLAGCRQCQSRPGPPAAACGGPGRPGPAGQPGQPPRPRALHWQPG